MSVTELVSEEFRKKGGFFELQLRDLAIIGSILLAVSTFILTQMGRSATMSATVNALSQSVSELKETVKTENQRLNDMDTKGTQASLAYQRLIDEKFTDENRRLTNIEATLVQLAPDVREIRTKVDLVTNYLGEDAKRHK